MLALTVAGPLISADALAGPDGCMSQSSVSESEYEAVAVLRDVSILLYAEITKNIGRDSECLNRIFEFVNEIFEEISESVDIGGIPEDPRRRRPGRPPP